nr:helix-turn-helix domain-containing protein [Algiphilus aromaticivorans]
MAVPVLGEWAMASQQGYGQFCPVAMAAEVLGSRWTILVLRELICGSTRFNELRRGVPRMSPALLSKRLTELEAHGLIARSRGADRGTPVYRLTQAGEELRPVIMSLGSWGQRWLESQLSLRNLDPSLLMWDMRRNLKPDALPERRITIQFLYPKLERGQRKWWLVVDKTAAHGPVDLCMIDPGHEIDVHVVTDLRTMTAVWMGITSIREAVDSGQLRLNGAPELTGRIEEWLGLSAFAAERKQVRA